MSVCFAIYPTVKRSKLNSWSKNNGLVGRNWFDTAIPEDWREQTKQWFAQIMSGGQFPLEYAENEVLTKKGQRRLVAWHNRTLHDEEERNVGTLSSGEDITDTREAEQAARHLAAIVQSSGDAIQSTTPDGIVTSWNLGSEHLFGFSAEEIVGEHVARLVPEDKLDEAGEALRALMEGEALDITERKRTERELEQSRNRLGTAFENMSDGIVLFDADDRLVTCNNQFRRMYPNVFDLIQSGISFEELLRAGVERGQYPNAIAHRVLPSNWGWSETNGYGFRSDACRTGAASACASTLPNSGRPGSRRKKPAGPSPNFCHP